MSARTASTFQSEYAMKSAFIPFDERLELLERVIWPAYAELRDV